VLVLVYLFHPFFWVLVVVEAVAVVLVVMRVLGGWGFVDRIPSFLADSSSSK
jgi:hypothetical protein